LQNPCISRSYDDNGNSTLVILESNSVNKEKKESYDSLEKIIKKYDRLNLVSPFPSLGWWQSFLDKGIVDLEGLKRSLVTSKYFKDENTPNWARLWHFTDLMDDEFEPLLHQVELEYQNREFKNIQEIKQVTGNFLTLSDLELYSKNKQDILQDAKLYIDDLKARKILDLRFEWSSTPLDEYNLNSNNGLGFQGKELQEFKDFCVYIDEARKSARLEKMPELAEELLSLMKQNLWEFYNRICSDGIKKESSIRYDNIPVLQYIKPQQFIEEIIQLKYDFQGTIIYSFKKRYEIESINHKLLEELDWLKNVRNLLLKESELRKGKISGYCLKSLVTHYLNEAITNLSNTSTSQ
jgi:hypothetical protein